MSEDYCFQTMLVKHIKSKTSLSVVEIHLDSESLDLEKIVFDKLSQKFKLTDGAYICQTKLSELLILEILRELRFHRWKVLTSNAFMHHGSEQLVETHFYMERLEANVDSDTPTQTLGGLVSLANTGTMRSFSNTPRSTLGRPRVDRTFTASHDPKDDHSSIETKTTAAQEIEEPAHLDARNRKSLLTMMKRFSSRPEIDVEKVKSLDEQLVQPAPTKPRPLPPTPPGVNVSPPPAPNSVSPTPTYSTSPTPTAKNTDKLIHKYQLHRRNSFNKSFNKLNPADTSSDKVVEPTPKANPTVLKPSTVKSTEVKKTTVKSSASTGDPAIVKTKKKSDPEDPTSATTTLTTSSAPLSVVKQRVMKISQGAQDHPKTNTPDTKTPETKTPETKTDKAPSPRSANSKSESDVGRPKNRLDTSKPVFNDAVATKAIEDVASKRLSFKKGSFALAADDDLVVGGSSIKHISSSFRMSSQDSEDVKLVKNLSEDLFDKVPGFSNPIKGKLSAPIIRAQTQAGPRLMDSMPRGSSSAVSLTAANPHEADRTKHYSKLGSAFLTSGNALAGGRGGGGRGGLAGGRSTARMRTGRG